MTVYLDCCATTDVDPAVRTAVIHYMVEDYGNEGSRTHAFGVRARDAVQQARAQVAAVVDARTDEVVFTGCRSSTDDI